MGACDHSFVECKIHCPEGYDTSTEYCTAIPYECE
jgi:hypothetical protein